GTDSLSASFDLLPKQIRQSGLLSVHEQPTDHLNLSADGIFTQRSFTQDVADFFSLSHNTGTVRQYGGTVCSDYIWDNSWHVATSGNYSRLRQQSVTVRDGILSPNVGDKISELESLDLQGGGPVLDTPSGQIKIALGVSGRRERLRIAPSTFIQAENLK